MAIFLAVVQVTQVAGKSVQEVYTKIVEEYAREKEREVLAGLQGVGVIVEAFRPEAEKFGFNRQQYQTDVELRLRQNGIKVFSRKEIAQVIGWPMLYINVNPTIQEKFGFAAVNVSVQLQEIVSLERNPTIKTTAYTWTNGRAGIVGFSRLNTVRGDVKELVDKFINDYLAANPKDHSTKKKGSVFDDFKPKNK